MLCMPPLRQNCTQKIKLRSLYEAKKARNSKLK